MIICQDIKVSEYKQRYPNHSENPQDIGLSSENKATGMDEQIGIAHIVTVLRPSPTTKPSTAKPTRSATPPTGPAELPEAM